MPRTSPGLTGSLHAIELSEVLQLLSQGTKSGALIVERGRVRKRIFLRDGKVVCVDSTEPREHLGRYLLRAGLVAPAALDRAEELRERQGMRLGESLLVLGAVAEEALAAELERKIEEACFECLRWPSGTFRFDPRAVPGFPLLPVVVGVTGIVMQGMVELDDWRRGIDNLSFRAEPSLMESVPGAGAGPSRPRPPRLTVFASTGSRSAWVGSAAVMALVLLVGLVGGAGRAADAPLETVARSPRAAGREREPPFAGVAPFALESAPIASSPLPAPRVPPVREGAAARPSAEESDGGAADRGAESPVADARMAALANSSPLAAPVAPVEPVASITDIGTTAAESAAETVATSPAPPDPEPRPLLAVVAAADPPPATIVAPEMTRQTRPRFPLLARHLRKSATVHLRVKIGDDGAVRAVEEVDPPAGYGFPEAARRAIEASGWRAGTRDGVATTMWIPVDVEFRP